MKKMKFLALLLSALIITSVGCNSNQNLAQNGQKPPEQYIPIVLQTETIKNVILFIGDGMGENQIKYGELYQNKKLSFQDFPCKTYVDTHSILDGNQFVITDSAASATAMATGVLTYGGRVGYGPTNINPQPLENLTDIAITMGKKTGIITTEPLSGATPMAFCSHSLSRSYTEELLTNAAKSGVNFFASDKTPEGTNYFTSEGYSLIDNLNQMETIESDYILADLPILAQQSYDALGNPLYVMFEDVINSALDYLSKDEDGFFLMAEGAHIDHGGHANDIGYMAKELLAFNAGVEAALKWAKNRTDTVIIVTADHETGGLLLLDNPTHANLNEMISEDGGFTYIPKHYRWTTTSHSNQNVGLYINGIDVDFEKYSMFETKGKIKNNAIFNIVVDMFNNNIR